MNKRPIPWAEENTGAGASSFEDAGDVLLGLADGRTDYPGEVDAVEVAREPRTQVPRPPSCWRARGRPPSDRDGDRVRPPSSAEGVSSSDCLLRSALVSEAALIRRKRAGQSDFASGDRNTLAATVGVGPKSEGVEVAYAGQPWSDHAGRSSPSEGVTPLQSQSAPEWNFSAWEIFTRKRFGPNAVLKQAAFVRNLQVDSLFPDSRSSAVYELSTGERKLLFWAGVPQTTTLVAYRVSGRKSHTKRLLERSGVQVPPGRAFPRDRTDAGWRFAKEIGLPVVVKPDGGNGGKGVTPNIRTEDDFLFAWTYAQNAYSRPGILVEKHVHGSDFRLFVVGDKVAAACWRVPASIEGDGESSIAELVAEKNRARRPNPHVGGYGDLKLTPLISRRLRELGLERDSVLDPGRRLTLTSVANIATGGESVDVTDAVHPDFRAIAVEARRSLPGVESAGIDLLVEKISSPAARQEWTICETNTTPDIALHHFPVWGKPRDAAGALIEHLFPGSEICKPPAHRTVRAVISGRVTGVGYRRWVWRRAQLRGLWGWVRNTGLGSVEAVFSGAPNAVEDMIHACRTGPRKARVQDIAVGRCVHRPLPNSDFQLH